MQLNFEINLSKKESIKCLEYLLIFPTVFYRGHFILSNTSCFVGQEVKNLHAVQETRVQHPSREDPLVKGMNGYPLQYSCLGNPMDRGAWWVIVHGAAK